MTLPAIRDPKEGTADFVAGVDRPLLGEWWAEDHDGPGLVTLRELVIGAVVVGVVGGIAALWMCL